MKNDLTIAICDTDNYFSEGIKHVLREYFHNKVNAVIFTRVYSRENPADFVFTSAPLNQRARYCTGNDMRTRFISIRKKTCARQAHRPACVMESGTLYRHDQPLALGFILDRVIATGLKVLSRDRCTLCVGSRFTAREQEVLDYLRGGISQVEAAEQMQLSVKTVHAHKQSVMRKMDLMRKHEFIHWLLHR